MAQPTARESAPLRVPQGTRIAAAISNYHADVTQAMLDSAERELIAAGLAPDDLLKVWVPGTFELPLVARRLAIRDDVQAVLCFGLVLRGETPHDRYLADAVSTGLMQVGLQTDKPLLFGVLTCDTLEQAWARALATDKGGTHDKGREVARAAIEVLHALEAAGTVGLARNPVGFALSGFAAALPAAGGRA